MGWFGWWKNKGGGKMNQIRISSIILILCATVLTISLYSSVASAQPCERWVAKVVSAQGVVQVLRTGEKQWRPVRLNDTFCPSDMIRILKLSRADIVLGNDAILRLDQNTTVTFSEPEKEKPFLVNLLNGAAYFFSRVRRSLKVFTPFVNAIVEGTEFYARVESDKAFISIFEGQVLVENQAGSITLAKGQSAIAEANRSPVLQIVVRPRDAVQWTLYYPPILYYRPSDFKATTGWEAIVLKSIEFYIEGNIQKAYESLEGVTEEIRDSRFFIYRASLLLSVGRVDEARSDIEKALVLAPLNNQGLALQSIIALVQNEKEKALSLAKRAVEADPKSGAARIALSYAQQSNFDLKGALRTLEDAVNLEPENALAWARLAEMWLMFGELNKALEAAQKAVSLDPNLSRTQTVLGFAYLTQVKTRKSKEAFEKAIELDQADPLPRLGLGLAKIREGGFPKWEPNFGKMVDKGLLEGTKELEIAVSLDPDNSLIRSYLGKAYYEEARDKLASNQLAIAKELDPSDPTPYFYDAIRKQSINQPVEALYDLQKSIELNDNRAVYRSKLLLDSDLAARSASIARIYTDLGFQQRALVEGWNSVNTDPTNYSAHRFLADSYSARPRHEIARVSELLQSQLLQPSNINPIQPRLAESNLFLISAGGPGTLSFNEFNPLFNRDRIAFQGSLLGGENSTYGGEGVISGIYKKASFSAGYTNFNTDGWKQNAEQKDKIANAFLQLELSPQTSIQAEYRYRDSLREDVKLNFFKDNDLPFFHETTQVHSVRVGGRHAFSPSSILIGNFQYSNFEYGQFNRYFFDPAYFGLTPPPVEDFSDFGGKDDAFSGELSYLYRSKYVDIVSGAGAFRINQDTLFTDSLYWPGVTPPLFFGTFPNRGKLDVNHYNIYFYSYIKPLRNLTLTFGASGDFYKSDDKIDGQDLDKNQFNPKFGVTWTPFDGTTVRGAVFRTLKRTLITDQTLEPTQVAGFNQFFDDGNATEAWVYGAAVDQRFSQKIYAGAEFSSRDLEVPYYYGATLVKKANWNEYLGRAYLYWTPHKWLAFRTEYGYEKFKYTDELNPGAREVKTHSVPLGVNFFHPSGLFARLQGTYYYQSGVFQRFATSTFESAHDTFCLVDAAVGYRVPKRYGILSVGVTNLFDKKFKYFEVDIYNSRIQPARQVFCGITFALP
jgi:tetratricopeptide (TPR) repeat protein